MEDVEALSCSPSQPHSSELALKHEEISKTAVQEIRPRPGDEEQAPLYLQGWRLQAVNLAYVSILYLSASV